MAKIHPLGGDPSRRYAIELLREAEEEFLSLPASLQDRFEQAIEKLKVDPRRPRPGLDVKKLQGSRLYRLRVGSHRAIYDVTDENRVVLVLLFDARGRDYARMIATADARRPRNG